MTALWFLVITALVLALLSLRGDSAKAAYWRLPAPPPGGGPPVTVMVPVKGHDEGLRENLAALAALDYPDFELIVCARDPADLPAGAVPATARLVYSGAEPCAHDGHTGEKIANLLAALAAARPASTVFVFADSDARPLPHWLRSLAHAALPSGTGVATGYRWYIPAQGGLASHLRSAWNSSIAGSFGPASGLFCWGGAMAIRRAEFERRGVAQAWRGQVSDDYVLADRVRRAGLRITFAPGALTPARDHTGFGELLAWSARQMLLTRIYRPELWTIALLGHLVYCAAMPAAVLLAVWGHPAALVPLALQLGVSMLKAARRCAWATAALDEPAGSPWLHAALAPTVTWLWLYALLASAAGNVLAWRGVRYRLRRTVCDRLN
ncbi:MAG: glycosyltransferase [Bryobacterales bacterium]|nr:glycosyltransferase [Bryobacterales bacterium]